MEKIHCFLIEDGIVKVHTVGLPERGDKNISHHFENVSSWKLNATGILNIAELDSIIGSSKNYDLKKNVEEKKAGIYNVSDQGFVFEAVKRCGCTFLPGPSKDCLAAGGKLPYKCVKDDLVVAIVSFVPQPTIASNSITRTESKDGKLNKSFADGGRNMMRIIIDMIEAKKLTSDNSIKTCIPKEIEHHAGRSSAFNELIEILSKDLKALE